MIKIILTLFVSSLIGYATNYIAVKMLFRPYKPIYFKGRRLPFTPGVIPKEQKRISKAIAEAVSDKLLTEEDLSSALLNEDISKKIAEKACASIYQNSDKTIADIISSQLGTVCSADKLKSIAADKIMEEIRSADIGAIVISEGKQAIKNQFSGGMMAMFVTDDLINSVAAPIGEKINTYIEENCPEKIDNILTNELNRIGNMTLPEAAEALEIAPQNIYGVVRSIYNSIVSKHISDIIKSVDIKNIIEQKVASMDVAELEELTMSVMKKELNSVINLGALIGLVIGVITVIINL